LRITFICSKTDDISVTEALKAVAENHPAHKLHAETGVLEEERDKLQETISQLKKRMTELDDEIDQCLTEITELKSAIAGPDDEDEILVSPGRSFKRATRGAAVEARKRQRQQLESDSEDTDSTLDVESSASEAEAEKERISRESAAQRLSGAEARLAALRTESKDLKKMCQPQQKNLREVKHEFKSHKSETKHACIKYRNDSVRPAIQSQFAQGIRE
jgi:chromosome segregation ATPase